MRMPPNTTSKQAVKYFADFFSGITEQNHPFFFFTFYLTDVRHSLVIMPCRTDAKGFVFTDSQIVKEELGSRDSEHANTVRPFVA